VTPGGPWGQSRCRSVRWEMGLETPTHQQPVRSTCLSVLKIRPSENIAIGRSGIALITQLHSTSFDDEPRVWNPGKSPIRQFGFPVRPRKFPVRDLRELVSKSAKSGDNPRSGPSQRGRIESFSLYFPCRAGNGRTDPTPRDSPHRHLVCVSGALKLETLVIRNNAAIPRGIRRSSRRHPTKDHGIGA
jgi:hypothetical protein